MKVLQNNYTQQKYNTNFTSKYRFVTNPEFKMTLTRIHHLQVVGEPYTVREIQLGTCVGSWNSCDCSIVSINGKPPKKNGRTSVLGHFDPKQECNFNFSDIQNALLERTKTLKEKGGLLLGSYATRENSTNLFRSLKSFMQKQLGDFSIFAGHQKDYKDEYSWASLGNKRFNNTSVVYCAEPDIYTITNPQISDFIENEQPKTPQEILDYLKKNFNEVHVASRDTIIMPKLSHPKSRSFKDKPEPYMDNYWSFWASTESSGIFY